MQIAGKTISLAQRAILSSRISLAPRRAHPSSRTSYLFLAITRERGLAPQADQFKTSDTADSIRFPRRRWFTEISPRLACHCTIRPQPSAPAAAYPEL